jgi:hypothetical protein
MQVLCTVVLLGAHAYRYTGRQYCDVALNKATLLCDSRARQASNRESPGGIPSPAEKSNYAMHCRTERRMGGTDGCTLRSVRAWKHASSAVSIRSEQNTKHMPRRCSRRRALDSLHRITALCSLLSHLLDHRIVAQGRPGVGGDQRAKAGDTYSHGISVPP